jgi:plasmid maintenance system killer protein
MDIIFKKAKFQKECNDHKILVRKYGPLKAKLLNRRLEQLRAAEVLEDLRNLPQVRCHELVGDRSGQLSVDLDHPYRLIFEPTEPIPRKTDGGLDWEKITSITILGIEDTHE